MPQGDLGILAEAQRETVRALATLTERLSPQVAQDQLPAPRIERVLTSTTQAVSELGSATVANAQAVSGLVRELGGLPALVAGLVGGGSKGGGSALMVLDTDGAVPQVAIDELRLLPGISGVDPIDET